MDHSKNIEFSVLKGTYAVCRLNPEIKIPSWILERPFFAITKTTSELSLVCDQADLPDQIEAERDWSIIKVLGPLDFNKTGIIATLSKALAEARIPIFVISTYETDYLLVKEKSKQMTVSLLATVATFKY
jgi:hypothetical protein